MFSKTFTYFFMLVLRIVGPPMEKSWKNITAPFVGTTSIA